MNYASNIFIMKILINLMLMIISVGVCFSQNLVPNGDFELYYNCPTDHTQIYNSKFWKQPTLGTCDYLHVCGKNAGRVPNDYLGYQLPHSGKAYAGIYLRSFYPGWREYIEVELSSPLVAGVQYYFEMYINLANTSSHTTNRIGVYFSSEFIQDTNIVTKLPYSPQIVNSNSSFPDTLNWTLVSGEYTALGGEKYLTIGNFYDDRSTILKKVNPNVSTCECAYFYIDDVSLSINKINSTKLFTMEDEIDVFYNSTLGQVIINKSDKNLSQLLIYDLSLKVLLNKSLTSNDNINIDAFQRGIYIYEIRDKRGVIKIGKIIK